jgi:hypothetical protein
MHSLEPGGQAVIRELGAAKDQAALKARAETTDQLNQIVRRLKQYRTEADWCDAVLDGAARFASETALFVLDGGQLTLRGVRNLALAPSLTFPLTNAAAFQNAADSKDTIVALRTAGEVSEALVAEPGDRAWLVPIVRGQRVAAILFACGEVDANALELVANLSAALLEQRSQDPVHVQIAPANPTKVNAAGATQRTLPAWGALPDEERMVHLHARRFARVKVAEMQFYRPEACHSGREQKNLYLYLKQDIDSARELFRNQFMTSPTIVDYLHLELVGALAENDETRLGVDYPGQMV